MGRGKLKFKGEKKAHKKSGSKKSSVGGESQHAADEGVVGVESATPTAASASASAAAGLGDKIDDAPLPSPKIVSGQGLISTSGTVVSGHGTAFKTELRTGDAIIATTPKGEEMRVVKMVLSQISISISSAFTSDLKTPTQFNFITKPRDEARERLAKRQEALAEKEEVEQRAMGTYGKKGEIVYREKTEHGGYRIRKEQTDRDLSRSDLLSVRAQKKSDRYC